MVHWVYILSCDDFKLYVGETIELIRRMRDHIKGRGSKFTEMYPPEKIIAIYKVSILAKFFEFNRSCRKSKNINNDILDTFNLYNDGRSHSENKSMENIITELLMSEDPYNFENIRGGKYTIIDREHEIRNEEKYFKDLPICDCGLPCNIEKNVEENCLYFTCAKRNFRKLNRFDKRKMIDDGIDIDATPCSVYQRYKYTEPVVTPEQIKEKERIERYDAIERLRQESRNILRRERLYLEEQWNREWQRNQEWYENASMVYTNAGMMWFPPWKAHV